MSIVRSAPYPKIIGITIAGAAIGALGVICVRTKKALAEDISRAKSGFDSTDCNTERDKAHAARAKEYDIPEFISKEV